VRLDLGIDIGGTNVKAALVSEEGTVAAFALASWSGGPPGDAVATALALRDELFHGRSDPRPRACGAGCAGLVDGVRGIVRMSPNLPSWRDVELARLLTDALGVETIVDNDANAAAYAEHAVGAARGATNAAVLTLGTGVGGGLILGGRLYRGSHGFAGEVGHATIRFDGPPCACGGTGCFERMVNAEAIVARARARADRGPSQLGEALKAGSLTAKDVSDAAARGDAAAAAVIEETGRLLGVGLANLVQILDLEIIVVGGGVASAGERLLAPARAEMAARVAGPAWRLPKVVPAELGEMAGVTGAALLASDRFRAPA
jgi:glucokinase